MELNRTWIDDAPDATAVRVCGEVRYDDRPGNPETYWIEVPRELADDITTTGNPWAVALLPLAATLGEPLILHQPVDSVLLGHLRQLQRVWRSWYPHLSVVPVVADADSHTALPGQRRTVAFFSGGVDSFFTLLRDRSADGERPIDDLLTIWGADVPLANRDAFERMRSVLQRVSDASGKPLVTAATNLRETRWAGADWGSLAHACGLVGVALMLERRWQRILVASSYDYGHLHPWGSHPLTDPLLSTAETAVVHDGADANRVEKTRLVADSPLAMDSLRVCWRGRSDQNCGQCEKCYRTMMTLWLLGALDRCSTFPAGSFDPGRIDRIFCRSHGATVFMREIRGLAVANGRADVVRMIDRALARSRRLVRTQAALTRIGAAIESRRFLRPASGVLQRIEWRLYRNLR